MPKPALVVVLVAENPPSNQLTQKKGRNLLPGVSCSAAVAGNGALRKIRNARKISGHSADKNNPQNAVYGERNPAMHGDRNIAQQGNVSCPDNVYSERGVQPENMTCPVNDYQEKSIHADNAACPVGDYQEKSVHADNVAYPANTCSDNSDKSIHLKKSACPDNGYPKNSHQSANSVQPAQKQGADINTHMAVSVSMSRRRALTQMLSAFAAVLLAPVAAFANAVKKPFHHVSGGFRNNHIGQINKPFSDLFKWRRESPGHPLLSFPLAENDIAFLQNNRTQKSLTWVGHATLLLQIGGINILTDPHFSGRASPVSFAGPKRGTPPGVAVNDLPAIDAVIISHNHYDHLDAASISMLAAKNPQIMFFCPLNIGDFLRSCGAQHITELDWGGMAEFAGLQFIAEPCQHWSSRFPWDRNKTLWASWVVRHEEFKFLFIGDTGYSPDFAALGERYGGFDWAGIPIGAYQPRWFMKEAHINPQESAQIFRDAKVKKAVALHWGTFQLTDEPMDEPPAKLRAMANVEGFYVLQHGETRLMELEQDDE